MSNPQNKGAAAAAAAAQQAAAAKSKSEAQESQKESTVDAQPVAPQMPVVKASEPEVAVVENTVASAEQEAVVVDVSNGVDIVSSSATMAPGSRGIVSAPKPAVVADLAPKQAPAMPRPGAGLAVTKSSKVDLVELESEMERILDGVPNSNRMQINGIVEYIKKCDPSQMISVEAVAKASVGLWHNLRLIICNEDKYFKQVFTAALRAFDLARTGAMSEIHLYRGADIMPLPAGDRKGFEQVTTMMRLLGPVKSRKTVLANSIKLTRALRDGLTQEGINRVLAYFDE